MVQHHHRFESSLNSKPCERKAVTNNIKVGNSSESQVAKERLFNFILSSKMSEKKQTLYSVTNNKQHVFVLNVPGKVYKRKND